MKLMSKLMIVLAIAGIAMVAQAKDKAAKGDPVLKGTVSKVDGANVTVTTAKKGDVVVATDDKTVVTVDGKDAKVADLKADMKVVVTPATGTATKIVSTAAAAAPK